VLAFSVSGRTREFGIRLAVGSQPRDLVAKVVQEGAAIAVVGIATGALAGYALTQFAQSYFEVQTPGAAVVIGSAIVLLGAAAVASLLPAARAARVDVMQALRSD
jgi:putative ABC transport system permease protein